MVDPCHWNPQKYSLNMAVQEEVQIEDIVKVTKSAYFIEILEIYQNINDLIMASHMFGFSQTSWENWLQHFCQVIFKHQRNVISICLHSLKSTFFICKNNISQTWALIIPDFKLELGKFETAPTWDYVLECFSLGYWIQ